METYDLFALISSLFPDDPFSHFSNPPRQPPNPDPFHKAFWHFIPQAKTLQPILLSDRKGAELCVEVVNSCSNKDKNRDAYLYVFI